MMIVGSKEVKQKIVNTSGGEKRGSKPIPAILLYPGHFAIFWPFRYILAISLYPGHFANQ